MQGSGDTSSAFARAIANVRNAIRELGLIVVGSALLLALGALFHHFSSLPSHYSWLEPIRTMWRLVFATPDFPAALTAVAAIGVVARSGAWDVDRLARALLTPLTGGLIFKTGLLLAMGAAVAFGDHLVFPKHTWRDAVAIAVLVAVFLARPRPRKETLGIVSAQAAVVTICFLAISYAYTVIKARLLIGVVPQDALIMRIETFLFGEPIHHVLVRYAANHWHFVDWCDWAYFRFFHHMWLTTVFLTAARLYRERTEYYGALVATYALGGPLYHLLPGYGPTFYEPALYEYLHQTPLTANIIREWLLANTRAVAEGHSPMLSTWSYIACFPSLHIAHEVVMLWYARHSKIAFACAAAFSFLTFLSVMVLGWHYFLDTLAGVIVAMIAIAIAHRFRDLLMPRRFAGEPDEPMPKKTFSLTALRAALRAAQASAKGD